VESQELLLTAARSVAVFVLMLVVVRALGKRTVGNFSAFDLLVALMLGEVVDEIIYGNVGFLQGTLAIVVLGTLAFLDAVLSFASRPLQRILEGKPAILIRHGKFQQRAMRAERLNEIDIAAMLRNQGVQDLREIKLAVLETDGELSVLKEQWAEPAQKSDLDENAQRERDQALDGQDEPPASARTDSPKLLGEAA
jgi:uncharacterized membrane protein YcaP (DUF421 family)